MKPRPLSMVRFDYSDLPVEHHSQYPFQRHRRYLFLGEIPNMPEHCIVVDTETGKHYCGYHTENFIEQD